MSVLKIHTTVYAPVEDATGPLKIEALQLILGHLYQGAQNAPTDVGVVQIVVAVDVATTDCVRFFVEYGGVVPAAFYYNKPDKPDDPPYISIGRGSAPIDPVMFFGTVTMLQRVAV